MRFDPPLVHGILVRRYKRFLADIALEDGSQITAHCPNPGSMLDVAVPDRPVALSQSTAPKRKLAYTWEMIRLGRSWVGINTARTNHLVAEALERNRIPELSGYDQIRREVPYGKHTRFDFLLGGRRRKDCYLEVKNVTLADGKAALFPDSVTVRGQKHLRELGDAVRRGHRAVMLFWVYRQDCESFSPADQIDPEYGRLLRKAVRGGVEVLVYSARVSPRQVLSGEPLRLRL
jgi:sugar fermentation stimulation protein A